jgi:hypothetical protein
MITALSVMEELVAKGVHEEGGKNRGLTIDSINSEQGLPMGSPYCAATVSHCFRQAHKILGAVPGIEFPYNGGSQAIMRAFKSLNQFSTNADDLLKWGGALGGWTDTNDPAHGHIFFIKNRFSEGDKVLSLGTLEANTSPVSKGRDGEGIYALTRSIEELGGHHPHFWFLRTDGIIGGEWWNKAA